VRWLPIRLIGEATGKLRGAIDERRLDELAASIRELGLLQPITVRLTVSGRFELIAGARRLRACEKLGMTHIDAIVLPAGEIDSDLLGIVENLQREPSHYIEEAETLDAILRKSGLSVQEMSGLIGISANALSAKLRLLRIPEPTRKLIRELDISERYARVLLKLTEESKQQSVARKIFENQLTLRDAESLVESILREAPATRRRVTGVVRDHRPYVNAMRDLTDQMRRTGIDAAIEVGETDTAVDVHIRMAKRGAASVTVGAD
jgi:ParB family chromosome partitioning protein